MSCKWIYWIFLVASAPAFAGFTEVGVSGNYRRSTIDSNNFQEVISYTGSVTYYFMEMSAIEASYTRGLTTLTVQPEDEVKVTTKTSFELIGLDFILTLGDREAVLQPYIKIGGAYIRKKIVKQPEGFDSSEVSSPSGLVPSAGLGLKVRLTKELSLKFGIDAWTSPPKDEPVVVDYAGRAGLSWMF